MPVEQDGHEHEWREIGECTHSGATTMHTYVSLACDCGAAAHRGPVIFMCGTPRPRTAKARAELAATQAAEREACPARKWDNEHKAKAGA